MLANYSRITVDKVIDTVEKNVFKRHSPVKFKVSIDLVHGPTRI